MIEIKRIEAAIARHPLFLKRLFTREERSYFAQRGFSPATIAGCFAAKEAAVKAAGGGFLRSVTLRWTEEGKPLLSMAGWETARFHVSISHSREYAVANVVIEGGVF